MNLTVEDVAAFLRRFWYVDMLTPRAALAPSLRHCHLEVIFLIVTNETLGILPHFKSLISLNLLGVQ